MGAVPDAARARGQPARRWAFESAALDLALRQAGTNLAAFLELEPQPLRYVVWMNLGDPPDLARLRRVRERYPGVGFKVDLSPTWTEATVVELARLGGIAAVDLKGHYHGSFEGPPPNADQNRWIAEGLPEAWIEDPWWEGPAWEALAPFRDRITWDANIHALADVVQLPFEPTCIAMYGGGQYEPGPGRGQIQYLFHPDAGNDVAPSGFKPRGGGRAPLAPEIDPLGFRWR